MSDRRAATSAALNKSTARCKTSTLDESQTWEEDLFSLRAKRDINQRSRFPVQSRPQILQVCISYYSPCSYADLRIPVCSSSSLPRHAGRFAATFLKPTRKPTPRSYRTFYRSMTASSLPRARARSGCNKSVPDAWRFQMPILVHDRRRRSLSVYVIRALSSFVLSFRILVYPPSFPFSNCSQENVSR